MDTQSQDGNAFLPALPDAIWTKIVAEIIFAPPKIWDLNYALVQIYCLSVVSPSLHRACKNVVLRIDARQGLDQHIKALSRLPVPVEYLDLDDFYNREYVLRSDTFRKYSGKSLKYISAAVRCTDTLQRFPALETIILHGQEVFPTLYSAVLANTSTNLKHLQLINYNHNIITDEVPHDVLERLESLIIQPSINTVSYILRRNDVLPTKLKKIHLKSDFSQLTAVNYSQHPRFWLPTVLAAAEKIIIEARFVTLNWGQEGQGPEWIAEELLRPPHSFKRLDLRLLDDEGIGLVQTAEPLNVEIYDMEDITNELDRLAPDGSFRGTSFEDRLHWQYSEHTEGIFEIYSLKLDRPIILGLEIFELLQRARRVGNGEEEEEEDGDEEEDEEYDEIGYPWHH